MDQVGTNRLRIKVWVVVVKMVKPPGVTTGVRPLSPEGVSENKTRNEESKRMSRELIKLRK